MIATAKRAKDRRIEKTQRLLHAALASLIREKPYDSIAVKEILDHANVGRSTFYTHFRDKDELLISCIRCVLRSGGATGMVSSAKRYERIIEFSLPIFEHVHQHKQKVEAKMGVKSRDIIHEHLQKEFAKVIADYVGKDFQGRGKTTSHISPDLLVRYVASTFILVLNWWVECSRLSPKEVNDVFCALVLPTLAVNFE